MKFSRAGAAALISIWMVAAPSHGAPLVQDDAKLFDKFDADGNGSLSQAEVGEWPWNRYDRNGDGVVTRAEFVAGREADRRRAETTTNASDAFRLLDWTNDGWLSGTELEGGKWSRFDLNADGRVSLTEFQAGRGNKPATPVKPRTSVKPTTPARPNPKTAPQTQVARKAAKPTSPAKPAVPQARPTGPVKWPGFGRYKVGDEVLLRWPGNARHERRKITGIRVYDFASYYQLDDERTYLPNYISGIKREPYWTGYFLGDWEVSMGLAVTTYTDGRNVYDRYTGGPKQPPLRVNADGTYQWRNSMNGKIIKGRWKPVPDTPGIILVKGLDGKDWTLYNNSDRTKHNMKPDEIGLWAPNELLLGIRPTPITKK